MLENRMVIDSEWGESEYGVPLPRKRDKWEEEDMDDEREQEPDDL
uniref:Uncharacterized protein n=1 Tax=Siphoviridae sp. ctmIh35 TaxID=2827932 RepID=A0A8S5T895_9CAUD|nr:MAG TPA: hypothetical protein [Siphoviridae sp. ctmIh35]